MKKIYALILLQVILSLLLIGCKATSVNPPASVAASGAGAGTPATVQVALGATSIANGGNTTVTATVLDGTGAPVANIAVNFSAISAATGSFSPTSAITNASGMSTSQFTASASNTTATIRASVVSGTTAVNGTALLTIGVPVPVPTSIVISLGSTTISNGNVTAVSATVNGAGGPISGAAVSFSVNPPTAGSFAPPSPINTVGGIAATTFQAAAPGDDSVVTIVATVGSLNNSAQVTIGNPAPPIPASMTLNINPLTLNIGASSSLVATVKDNAGNPAYNNLVTFLITGGTGSGSFSTAPAIVSTVSITTDSSGIASTTFHAGSISGQVNFSASTGAVPPKSGSLIITSNPESISLAAASGSLVNGQNTNVIADVRNILNNPVSDGTQVTFTMSYAGAAPGALSSATAFTVGGLARVTFSADASATGPVFITAAAGTPAINSNTVLINVTPALPGSIQFISAEPQAIMIGSGNTSSVKFKVLSSTGGIPPFTSVDFSMVGPNDATVDISGTTDSSGEVTTTLHAGMLAGPVVITATVQGTTISTTSGNVSIGGGVPSDRFLSVSASKLNLAGLGCDGQTSIINVLLADRFGNYNILERWSVSFATDAGAIDTSNVTDAAGATTASYRTQAPRPNDVPPVAGEPSYSAVVTGPSGTYLRTFNPRDGHAGIVVYTSGEEHFQDDDFDGVFDSGEPFTDIPEPFIDSNDSGTWDTGEMSFDWPISIQTSTLGQYNPANNVWDRQIPIFRNFPLAITGRPDFSQNTTHIVSLPTSTGDIVIPKGSSVTFMVTVSDINMNSPIGGTSVSMTSDNTDAKITHVGGFQTLPDGLSFGPSFVYYTVTNKSSATAAASFANITYAVDWPGPAACGGAIKTSDSYPGTVTLQ